MAKRNNTRVRHDLNLRGARCHVTKHSASVSSSTQASPNRSRWSFALHADGLSFVFGIVLHDDCAFTSSEPHLLTPIASPCRMIYSVHSASPRIGNASVSYASVSLCIHTCVALIERHQESWDYQHFQLPARCALFCVHVLRYSIYYRQIRMVAPID